MTRSRGAGPRVVVEPSTYAHNLGDLAMLQAAVGRVADLWPAATIEVLTGDPAGLRTSCPGVQALAAGGRDAHLAPPARGGDIWRRLPPSVRRAGRAVRAAGPRARGDRAAAQAFVEAISAADLVLVSGGGGTTDEFPWDSHNVLDLLELAARSGAATAMVGQGFGPLRPGPLLRRARQVLPTVDLITVRERRSSVPLLDALGVPPERVMVTGDEAIGVARPGVGPATAERLLGVNLRVAPYSGIDWALSGLIGAALRTLAVRLGAELCPLPVSFEAGRSDDDAIQRSVGLASPGAGSRSPAALSADAARCRVVVTASYHPAVFALSQGRPAVGLARSRYYLDKFRGLADMFGPGCEVVVLDGGWQVRLADAVGRSWRQADALHGPLVQAAERQMALTGAAYGRLREVVEGR